MADNNNAKRSASFNPADAWNAAFPNFMDMTAWRQQWSKQMETMQVAQHMALDYLKEATRKAADTWQKNSKSASDWAQHAMQANSYDEARACQADAMAMVMEHSIAQMNEAAEMWARANKELFSLCNKNMADCMAHACKK